MLSNLLCICRLHDGMNSEVRRVATLVQVDDWRTRVPSDVH